MRSFTKRGRLGGSGKYAPVPAGRGDVWRLVAPDFPQGKSICNFSFSQNDYIDKAEKREGEVQGPQAAYVMMEVVMRDSTANVQPRSGMVTFTDKV